VKVLPDDLRRVLAARAAEGDRVLEAVGG